MITARLQRMAGGLAMCMAMTTPAQPQPALTAYTLDPSHTSVYWEAVHMGTSTLRGRFDRIDGTVRFDAARQQLDLGIRIDTRSVSTGQTAFDAVLRGAGLLASDEFPEAWFVAQRGVFDGARLREVTGEFTLRGQSQPLTLRATRWACGFNPLFRREVCGGDFEAVLSRGSFGMTAAGPLVGDEVRLRIGIEAIKADTER